MSAAEEWFDDEPVDYEQAPQPLADQDDTVVLQSADWHLRQLAKIRRQVNETVAMYDAEQARLRDREQARLDTLQRQAAWHEEPLKDLHAALLEADPTRKTIHLPHGDLKARVAKAVRYEVTDRDAFVAFALNHEPVLVAPHWKPVLEEIKRFARMASDGVAVTPDGEIIDGLSATVPAPSFSVSTLDD